MPHLTYLDIVKTSGDTTLEIPADCTNIIAIHAIGGGQAGFDGDNGISYPDPGGLGGKGADWAVINSPSLVQFPPGTSVDIQVGLGGAANGAAGQDSWVKDKDGTITLLARGGDSATIVNQGDDSNPGGSSKARETHIDFPAGPGGGAGGGAGGPDGPGADGGGLNGRQISTVNDATQPWGGCGGGGANGGEDGASLSNLYTLHRESDPTFTGYWTHWGTDPSDPLHDRPWGNPFKYSRSIGRDTFDEYSDGTPNGGMRWQIVGGDGGAGPSFADAPDVVLLGAGNIDPLTPGLMHTNIGGHFLNAWGIFGGNQLFGPGFCAGGEGAAGLLASFFQISPDPGATWYSTYGTGYAGDGLRLHTAGAGAPARIGGPGNLISWRGYFAGGLISPSQYSGSPTYRGPGGGAGGGAGGVASGLSNGARGGLYGGGGGGGGNTYGDAEDDENKGGPGANGIIIMLYERSTIYSHWSDADIIRSVDHVF